MNRADEYICHRVLCVEEALFAGCTAYIGLWYICFLRFVSYSENQVTLDHKNRALCTQHALGLCTVYSAEIKAKEMVCPLMDGNDFGPNGLKTYI